MLPKCSLKEWEINLKYEGYLKKQEIQINQAKKSHFLYFLNFLLKEKKIFMIILDSLSSVNLKKEIKRNGIKRGNRGVKVKYNDILGQ